MTSDCESSFDALLREAAELRVPSGSPVQPPERGELLQEKYRIDGKLGEGGMGAVFRATHIENGKQVAIKWLLGRSPQAALRFSREAQAAAQIDHPNVVNVFDVGSHRGGRFLVMELLRGESLGVRIRRERIAARELVAIMIPVLRGVAAAHRAGVIHRDLKPDNVFLCVGPDGAAREPKVLDFGISKLRSAPALEERLTSQGTGIGTLAYMSPEQLVDAPNVDERTDIYAAGVMMYEALTGRLPFRAESYNALVLAIAAQRPLPIGTLIDGVPPALERVILRAMAKDAPKRQPDVLSLIGELESCLGGDMKSAAAPRAQDETRKRRQRWSLLAFASVPLLIALWFATHPPDAPRSIAYARVKQAPASVSQAAPPRPTDAPRQNVQGTQPEQPPSPAPAEARVATHAPVHTKLARVPARSPAGTIRLSDL